ncbi:MAG: hypothetical protein MUF16_26735 [Burkholderiaceae bacterium]|jgi:hypothetical protein|nr:hypothetical protein [Burkholderiaceae bacterium]
MNARLLSLGRRLIVLAAFGLAAATPARAQGTPADCDLRIAGGPAGKVYELMIRDMQAACGSAVQVCSVTSTGGLQNLSLIAANEAELGIVQLDTLKEMKARGDDALQALQVVMPLHGNLLHVLVLTEGSEVDVVNVPLVGTKVPFTGSTIRFDKVSQLRGRTVVAVGSAQLMARSINAQYPLGLQLLAVDTDAEALRVLQAGHAQAVFTLGGWPLPSVAQHRTGSGLMLADFDLQDSAPYAVVTRSYPNLQAYNLRFLAAPNVLVTRPFRVGGTAFNRVAALQRCLATRLDELQEGRYQPAWKEIRDVRATYGLKSFSAVAESTPTAGAGVAGAAKAR